MKQTSFTKRNWSNPEMISYAQYMGLLSGQTFIKYGCTFHLLAYNPDEDTQYRRDLGLVWMSGHCVWIQYSQGNHDVSFAICICDYKMHLVSLLRFSSSFSLFIDVYTCIWYIIIWQYFICIDCHYYTAFIIRPSWHATPYLEQQYSWDVTAYFSSWTPSWYFSNKKVYFWSRHLIEVFSP